MKTTLLMLLCLGCGQESELPSGDTTTGGSPERSQTATATASTTSAVAASTTSSDSATSSTASGTSSGGSSGGAGSSSGGAPTEMPDAGCGLPGVACSNGPDPWICPGGCTVHPDCTNGTVGDQQPIDSVTSDCCEPGLVPIPNPAPDNPHPGEFICAPPRGGVCFVQDICASGTCDATIAEVLDGGSGICR